MTSRSAIDNAATRIVTVVVAINCAIAGVHHGFFELLQGSRPTTGLIIQAIGPAQRMWPHGTEEAFTLLPNYLAAGVAALVLSVAAGAWAIAGLRRRHGRTVFVLLFGALTLVGGGIGFVVYFIPAWAYATRLDRPMTGWNRLLAPGLRRILSPLWRAVVGGFSFCFLLALEISVFGVFPGVSDPDVILRICWSLLLAAIVLMHLAYASAAAADLEARRRRQPAEDRALGLPRRSTRHSRV